MTLTARTVVAVAAAMLAACTSLTTNSPAVGTYRATLPAASGGGERTVDVTLSSDYSATLSTAFPGRPSRSLVQGRWVESKSEITLSLEGPRQELIVFAYSKDRLVAKHWDRASWGEAGPGTLTRGR